MLTPGDTFERYTVLEVLGAGGMGRVYRARDERLGREVALKVLLSDSAEARARMLREARAAAALNHPNVVSVFDVGDAEAGPHIVMELVGGDTLRSRLSGASAAWTVRVRWLTDVARALEAAHARGIIHRDVKPENVMIRPDGVVKVLDFGIARRGEGAADPSAPTEASLPTITTAGSVVGTPMYMAPEQIKGDPIDGRTDQFAWGVVAYEVLAGQLPWRTEGGALAVAASILTDAPAPLAPRCAGLPSPLARVVERALAKRPEERFGSMTELLAALQVAQDDGGEGDLAPSANGAGAPRGAAPPASPRARPAVRYSTEQMKAIFERALRTAPGSYEREDLVEAAREIGIDDAALDEAMREIDLASPRLLQRDAERRQAERREERARQGRSFVRHLAGYLIVNVVLYFMMGGWSRWTLMLWGIFLALHLLNVIIPKDRDRRGRKSRKERSKARDVALERELEPRAERADSSPAVSEGVRILLSTSSRLRAAREPSPGAAEREAQAQAEDEDELGAPHGPGARQKRR